MNTRSRSSARPQGGFTMIEVLISILLCAICVIGMIALYRINTRSSGYSRRVTEAAVLAQDKLEEVRSLAPTIGTSTETTLDALGVAGSGPYTRTTVIGGSTTLYTVDVTVSWTEDGNTRSVVVKGQRGGSS